MRQPGEPEGQPAFVYQEFQERFPEHPGPQLVYLPCASSAFPVIQGAGPKPRMEPAVENTQLQETNGMRVFSRDLTPQQTACNSSGSDCGSCRVTAVGGGHLEKPLAEGPESSFAFGVERFRTHFPEHPCFHRGFAWSPDSEGIGSRAEQEIERHAGCSPSLPGWQQPMRFGPDGYFPRGLVSGEHQRVSEPPVSVCAGYLAGRFSSQRCVVARQEPLDRPSFLACPGVTSGGSECRRCTGSAMPTANEAARGVGSASVFDSGRANVVSDCVTVSDSSPATGASSDSTFASSSKSLSDASSPSSSPGMTRSRWGHQVRKNSLAAGEQFMAANKNGSPGDLSASQMGVAGQQVRRGVKRRGTAELDGDLLTRSNTIPAACARHSTTGVLQGGDPDTAGKRFRAVSVDFDVDHGQADSSREMGWWCDVEAAGMAKQNAASTESDSLQSNCFVLLDSPEAPRLTDLECPGALELPYSSWSTTLAVGEQQTHHLS